MVLSRQELENLKVLAKSRIREIAEYFIKDFVVSDTLLIAPCPVHGGDNYNAFNINIDKDDDFCGKWFCNTNQCHEDYPNDVVGFVQAMLERKNGYCHFGDSVEFVKKFLDASNDDLSRDLASLDTVTKFFAHKRKGNSGVLRRREIRKRLIIPPTYYIKRGFAPETLDYFDVGLCLTKGSQMYMRVVFPIYDEDDDSMIGCVGRDTTETSNAKWINSKGFNKASYLYNYAKAVKEARQCGELYLCEGQGDVMRFHEAGIHNAVGLFGCSISDGQKALLEKSGALTLILALDPNKAGEKGREKIMGKCGDLFNIRQLKLPDERDVGDLTVQEIRGLI